MASGLEGIRVIQTAAFRATPMAARLLTDWGADVIAVEHITRKQQMSASSYALREGKRRIASNIDYREQNHNRNKRSITLNLSHEIGRKILYKLLEKADVYLSNFRPRELEKFKLEYETLSQLNPRLICAHLTAFGRKGPDKDGPGYGGTGDARSGFLHVLQVPGDEPPQMPTGVVDYLTGFSLAYGIMTALFIRERTGVVQEVDVSLLNTLVWLNCSDTAGALVTGKDRQAVRRKDRGTPLSNTYQTKDGRWLYVSVREDYWARFCRTLEHEELEHDPRFESLEARAENHLALFNILEEAFSSKTLDEWKSCLTEAEIPWSPLQTLPELIKDPQARANDFFLPLDHPTYGRIEVVANPVKLSRTPETIRMPAPEVGQHTEEILLEYGYTHGDIERFRQQGVIV